MAKIKLGALAQDVRGSLAGSTFARNKGGSYVRQKVSPTQPQSPLQTMQRQILAAVAALWAATTAAVRAEWYAYAEANPVTDVFGDAVRLNGAAAFAKLNAVLKTCALNLITTPPIGAAPAAAVVGGMTITDAGTLTVNFSTALNDNVDVMLFAWPTKPNQTAVPKSQLRFAGHVAGLQSAEVTMPNVAARNPLLTVSLGQRLHVRVVQIDLTSGRVVGVATTSGIVEAAGP